MNYDLVYRELARFKEEKGFEANALLISKENLEKLMNTEYLSKKEQRRLEKKYGVDSGDLKMIGVLDTTWLGDYGFAPCVA